MITYQQTPTTNAGLSYTWLPAISMDALIVSEVNQRGYHQFELEDYVSNHVVSGTLIIHSVKWVPDKGIWKSSGHECLSRKKQCAGYGEHGDSSWWVNWGLVCSTWCLTFIPVTLQSQLEPVGEVMWSYQGSSLPVRYFVGWAYTRAWDGSNLWHSHQGSDIWDVSKFLWWSWLSVSQIIM